MSLFAFGKKTPRTGSDLGAGLAAVAAATGQEPADVLTAAANESGASGMGSGSAEETVETDGTAAGQTTADEAVPAVHTIGQGMTLYGTLGFRQTLLFGGLLHGQIDGDGDDSVIQISAEAVVEGPVNADTVVVFGQVEGNITARLVVIHDGARVVGEVSAVSLEIEPGADIDGKIITRKNVTAGTEAGTAAVAKP